MLYQEMVTKTLGDLGHNGPMLGSAQLQWHPTLFDSSSNNSQYTQCCLECIMNQWVKSEETDANILFYFLHYGMHRSVYIFAILRMINSQYSNLARLQKSCNLSAISRLDAVTWCARRTIFLSICLCGMQVRLGCASLANAEHFIHIVGELNFSTTHPTKQSF